MFSPGCETTRARGCYFSLAKMDPSARGKLLGFGRRLGRRAVPWKSHQTLFTLKGAAQARALGAMPLSTAQATKRALVRVLKSLARTYGVAVDLTCDAADADVRAAYRRVFLRAHPDKGGSVGDAQRLSDPGAPRCAPPTALHAGRRIRRAL